jgi:hypothetical protein
MNKINSPENLWFEYITKINDRALRKRQSSGFTNWAICGLLIILLYRISESIPHIFTNISLFEHFLIILCSTFNIIYSISFIFIPLLLKASLTSEIRLASQLSRISKQFISIPLFIISFGLIFLNFYVAFKYLFVIRWPFFVLGIFYLINILTSVFDRIRLLWVNRGVYSDLPALKSDPVFHNRKLKKFFANILLSIFIILLIIAIIPVFIIIKEPSIARNLTIFKFCFEIAAFLYVSLILLYRVSTLFESEFMESLERRIVLENLSSEEIKNIFIREYLGETISGWLNKVEAKLTELYNDYDKAVKVAESELEKINQIDKEYPYEIKGRLKELCDNTHKYIIAYREYDNKLMKHVEYLVNQKAFMAEKEIFKQFLSI